MIASVSRDLSNLSVAERLATEAGLLAGGQLAGLYADRIVSAADTVAHMRPQFARLGITRLASVTDLDRIGIPVFFATRPNARTLAVTQGKGIDEDAARASAIMEAAEQAIAECPSVGVRVASQQDLATQGESFVNPARFVRKGTPTPAQCESLEWIEGFDLLAQTRCWVPRDAAALDFTSKRAHPFWQSSDGLASGNILLEAVLHGLSERIERDASALWSFCHSDCVLSRCVDPHKFKDPVLSRLTQAVTEAGLGLSLFDITSDIEIPVYFAVISAPRPSGREWQHFDLSRGTGCHPIGVRAAIRAVTEAAQSRLTSISGARDDFLPELYQASLKPDLHIFRHARPSGWRPNLGSPSAGSAEHLRAMLNRLRVRGVRSVVVTPLGGEDMGFSVAKVIVADLEDPPESRHRHFGRRAVNAMLAGAWA